MQFATTTSFFVLVNGILGEHFRPERDTPQGDPILANIFIFAFNMMIELI